MSKARAWADNWRVAVKAANDLEAQRPAPAEIRMAEGTLSFEVHNTGCAVIRYRGHDGHVVESLQLSPRELVRACHWVIETFDSIEELSEAAPFTGCENTAA